MFARFTNIKFYLILLGDALLIAFAFSASFYLRFDGVIPQGQMELIKRAIYWIVPVKLAIMMLFRVYRGMWRYTGLWDLYNIVKAAVFTSALIALSIYYVFQTPGFSRGVLVIDLFLTISFIAGFRIGIRTRYQRHGLKNGRRLQRHKQSSFKRIIIVGAGSACEALLREINQKSTADYHVVGLLDDNRKKLKKAIHGVKVIGTSREIPKMVKKYAVDEVIIATPRATEREMRSIW